MKNKLPKKKEEKKAETQESILHPKSQEELIEDEQKIEDDATFIPRLLKKQALFTTFTGMIQTGFFQEDDQLTLFASIVHGADWKRITGEKNYISQIASSNGDYISWNMPFQISFQTTYPAGWPQLIVALYGTDFFGRAFLRGYGNIHLPSSHGKQKRKMHIFRPLPQSTISGIFGFINGTVSQYKDYQKILSSGDGRQVTRVKSIGQINLSIQTIKYNFKNYGYQ